MKNQSREGLYTIYDYVIFTLFNQMVGRIVATEFIIWEYKRTSPNPIATGRLRHGTVYSSRKESTTEKCDLKSAHAK